jgi:hypothetical protein
MGWLNALSGSVVGLDTAPLIMEITQIRVNPRLSVVVSAVFIDVIRVNPRKSAVPYLMLDPRPSARSAPAVAGPAELGSMFVF